MHRVDRPQRSLRPVSLPFTEVKLNREIFHRRSSTTTKLFDYLLVPDLNTGRLLIISSVRVPCRIHLVVNAMVDTISIDFSWFASSCSGRSFSMFPTARTDKTSPTVACLVRIAIPFAIRGRPVRSMLTWIRRRGSAGGRGRCRMLPRSCKSSLLSSLESMSWKVTFCGTGLDRRPGLRRIVTWLGKPSSSRSLESVSSNAMSAAGLDRRPGLRRACNCRLSTRNCDMDVVRAGALFLLALRGAPCSFGPDCGAIELVVIQGGA